MRPSLQHVDIIFGNRPVCLYSRGKLIFWDGICVSFNRLMYLLGGLLIIRVGFGCFLGRCCVFLS